MKKSISVFSAISIFGLFIVFLVGGANNWGENRIFIPHENGDVIVYENQTIIKKPGHCTLHTRREETGLKSRVTCYRGRPSFISSPVETPKHVVQIWDGLKR